MKMTVMDYLNWNPTMPFGLKHGWHGEDGISFGWLDLKGVPHYASADTIEKAAAFIAGFNAGLGADH
jgi:mannose/cellobiose epimerase-like protein (N-acyl-D-glucosamine 2-epimerase family)